MAPLITNLHIAGAILFAAYGVAHIAHHTLGAFLGPEWHMATQSALMPRGVIEKVFIILPVATTYATGIALLYQYGRETIRALTGNQLSGGGDGGGAKPDPTSDLAARATIRRIQLVSAVLLGSCLSLHLPAITLIRYFRNGESANYYAAAHAMHHGPVVLRVVFCCYYAVFVTAFFAHGVASWAHRDVKAEPGFRGARGWLRNVVRPMLLLGAVVGVICVFGLYTQTSAASTDLHMPDQMKH
jgi:hypothetical protein